MSNAAWAILLVAALLAASVLARVIDRNSSLLVIAHNAVWAGAIALIGTDLITYTTSSTQAWLILFCGLAFFNVGSILAQSGHTDPALHLRGASNIRERPLLTRRMLLCLFAIYSLGVAAYLSTIQQRFGLELLLTDPTSIRGAQGESYLESVPLGFRVLLYLGPLLFVVLGYRTAVQNPLPFWLRASGMVLLAVSMLALLQRTNLFIAMLWLIALLASRGQKRDGRAHPVVLPRKRTPTAGPSRRTRVLGPVILGALVLTLAFQLVGNALGKAGDETDGSGSVSPALAESGLTSMFSYYTGGTVAFLQLTESSNDSWPPPGTIVYGDYNPQTWGAATFAPILNLVPVAEPWESIAPFIDVGIVTNVYTWLEPLYRDFRLAGVVIGMSALGYLSTRLHKCRFISARAFWLQGTFGPVVLLAPFVARFNSPLWLASLLLVLALTNRAHARWVQVGHQADRHQEVAVLPVTAAAAGSGTTRVPAGRRALVAAATGTAATASRAGRGSMSGAVFATGGSGSLGGRFATQRSSASDAPLFPSLDAHFSWAEAAESMYAAGAPAIFGAAAVGKQLRAEPGAWGPAVLDFAYEWHRDGAPISGATSSAYQLVPADAGALITVRVTGHAFHHDDVVAMSRPRRVGKQLTSTPAPRIAGTPAVGKSLTALQGTWGPRPVTVTYRWYRTGKLIPGATARSYRLTANDAGKAITVRVTGSKPRYSSVSRISDPVAVEKVLTGKTPTIYGVGAVGRTLTAVTTPWGPGAVTLSFQWHRSGAPIPGATDDTYTVSAADARRSITVHVEGRKPGYTAAGRRSAPKRIPA